VLYKEFIWHINALYRVFQIDFLGNRPILKESWKWKEQFMRTKTPLFKNPPYDLEKYLVALGQDLRTARVRRNFTIADVAEKIGTGVRAIADAEKGKISTGAGVYFALLWVYGLLDQISFRDEEGERLASFREKSKAYAHTRGIGSAKIDHDF